MNAKKNNYFKKIIHNKSRMKNATEKQSAFLQANLAMQPSAPMQPLYIMYPDALPKPPQKRRKLNGTGDKNGGEKLRIFSRLKGFKPKDSLVWTEITRRFGAEIKHGELLSIAEVVAANAGIQLDRDAKRRKSVLIKWFEENWFQILPYLNYVILEDKKNQNNGSVMSNYQTPGYGFNMTGFSGNNNFNNPINSQPKMGSYNPISSNFSASTNSVSNFSPSIYQNNFQNNSMWQNNNSVNNGNNNQLFQNKVAAPNFNSMNDLYNNNKLAQNIVNSIQIQNWMQIQSNMIQNQNNSQNNSQPQMFTPQNQAQIEEIHDKS